MFETRLVAYLADLAPDAYPGAAPLDYFTPAVVYNRVSTIPVTDMDGHDGMGWVVLQIDVYDPSFLTAKQLAHDIREEMIAWQDDGVQSVYLEGESDSVDQTTETTLYRTMLTFSVFCSI